MAEEQVERRLAAILAADVVGYSRLMGKDEATTLAALKLHRRELIDGKIAEHDGRIVKLTGDGILAEFPSVVNAVACAAEIQRGMLVRNADVPKDNRLDFRVGVTLGDVVVEGDDIFGDGVNLAARLESIADPGGLAISATARDHIGRRLDLAFEDMGEQVLKNIDQPIRVWKWHPIPSDGRGGVPQVSQQARRNDFPSLAVLPFQNMSGDAEQEYFADGIVEDLITAFSRFRSFSVIARNSSFVYKGRPVDVRQVAKELGVRYVLEGSVRRSGNRLRITAQLVDGATGAHLWANKFDGAVADVFDVQDQVTESVVGVVQPEIQKAEFDRSRGKRPDSLDAYDLYLQAVHRINMQSGEENAAGLALLERAIEMEPTYANALALAAASYEHRVSMGWPPASVDDAERSLVLERRALASAPDDPTVLTHCGMVRHTTGRDYDQGLRMLMRALEANPNDALIVCRAGITHLKAGSLEEAMRLFDRTIRLSPADAFVGLTGIAHAHMALGNYEEALDFAQRSLAEKPNFPATHWMLIAANAYLGRIDEAKRALAALEKLIPGINLARIRRGQHAKEPHRTEVLIEGMRLAGMPET